MSSRSAGPRCAITGVVALALVLGGAIAQARAREKGPPSIVLVVTDDQRYDTLRAMPATRQRIAQRGVRFDNGFVVNSLCCPSRATMLTGDYSHSTGVYRNFGRFGGFGAFDDRSTIATRLQSAGYKTALFGKYFNGYGHGDAGYIPPGWDKWVAKIDERDREHLYYNYLLSRNGRRVRYSDRPADYLTDLLARNASRYIRKHRGPLFIFFAPTAPHAPATPPTRYLDAYPGVRPYRPPSFNEADVSDKPLWVRNLEPVPPHRTAASDALRKNQLGALRAVDDGVGSILNALADSGRIHNTLIVLTSDNGLSFGEHRWSGKQTAYEENIRVPYVVRYDRGISNPRRDEHLVTNLDLAPTFARVAREVDRDSEGRSLRRLLASEETPWRKHFLVEHLGKHPPSYCAVRSERFAHVAYATGEEELYDLATDPYQLSNVGREPAYAPELATMRRRVARLCSPPPPGFTLTSPTLAWESNP
jgi:N-acetylglucosamine-6-sulfatase